MCYDSYQYIIVDVFQIWDDIISGRAIDDPSLLSRFLLLTHAVSDDDDDNCPAPPLITSHMICAVSLGTQQ